jgi:hypothetical protein
MASITVTAVTRDRLSTVKREQSFRDNVDLSLDRLINRALDALAQAQAVEGESEAPEAHARAS